MDGRHVCRNKMVQVYILYFIYIELEWTGPDWGRIFGFHPASNLILDIGISPQSRFTLKSEMFVESYLKSELRSENHSNISSQRLRNVLLALSCREVGEQLRDSLTGIFSQNTGGGQTLAGSLETWETAGYLVRLTASPCQSGSITAPPSLLLLIITSAKVEICCIRNWFQISSKSNNWCHLSIVKN